MEKLLKFAESFLWLTAVPAGGILYYLLFRKALGIKETGER